MALKTPVPLPFCTLLSAVVGPVEVFQTMPRSDTLAPPSEVTFPPRVALVAVTALWAAVVTVGAVATGPVGTPSKMLRKMSSLLLVLSLSSRTTMA